MVFPWSLWSQFLQMPWWYRIYPSQEVTTYAILYDVEGTGFVSSDSRDPIFLRAFHHQAPLDADPNVLVVQENAVVDGGDDERRRSTFSPNQRTLEMVLILYCLHHDPLFMSSIHVSITFASLRPCLLFANVVPCCAYQH